MEDLASIPQVRLEDRQKRVVEALSDRADLRKIYLSGITVLAHVNIPNYIVLAAHAFRELMEKLPESMGFREFNPTIEYAYEFQALSKLWTDDICDNHPDWEGEIGESLRVFLFYCQTFFEKYRKRPDRSGQIELVFSFMDKGPMALPETLRKDRVRQWMSLRDFL